MIWFALALTSYLTRIVEPRGAAGGSRSRTKEVQKELGKRAESQRLAQVEATPVYAAGPGREESSQSTDTGSRKWLVRKDFAGWEREKTQLQSTSYFLSHRSSRLALISLEAA